MSSSVVAVTEPDSIVEILIPLVQQMLLVPFDDGLDLIDLFTGKPSAPLETNEIKPELRFGSVALDMNMRGLISIARIEEEPKRTVAEDCRHNSGVPVD